MSKRDFQEFWLAKTHIWHWYSYLIIETFLAERPAVTNGRLMTNILLETTWNWNSVIVTWQSQMSRLTIMSIIMNIHHLTSLPIIKIKISCSMEFM